MSPYNYALNDPLLYVDPDGRAARGSDCCNFTFQRVVGDFFNFSVNRTQQNVQTAVTNVQTDAITMVKEGPGALDYATLGLVTTSATAAGITLTTANPYAAVIASVAAKGALVSDGTALILTGIDAAFLGGEVAEVYQRAIRLGIGTGVGLSFRFATNQSLYRMGVSSTRREVAAEVAGGLGGTAASDTINRIQKEDE